MCDCRRRGVCGVSHGCRVEQKKGIASCELSLLHFAIWSDVRIPVVVRQNLEKVLGDQDDLAASRDEDPAEDSTDISADMYAYLLNRLKGRTLDWEPFAKVALSLYSVYKQDWLCLWMLWQDRIVKGNRSPTWRILWRR